MIDRLKHVFSTLHYAKHYPEVAPATPNTGTVAGSDAPIVILLTGTFRNSVIEYFKTEWHMSETEARVEAKSPCDLYVVFADIHRHIAILDPIEGNKGRWRGFS